MNAIRDTIAELNKLMSESEELRDQLVARGVPAQTINVLVEMGFHNRVSEHNALISSALGSAKEAFGQGAVTQEELSEQVEKLVSVEKDIAHCRRVAKQKGLDLHAINMLARIIRENPGDGGEKVVNTFLGYSQACKVNLSGIDQITQKYTAEPESVLPQIERPVEDIHSQRNKFFRDVFVGLTFAIVLMALIV